VALGVEGFTILAVLEARDKMSSIFERAESTISKFSETVGGAADTARAAGAAIDESLLQTASGSDAVELANARLSASQDAVSITTKAQADAQLALLDVQAKLAAGELDASEGSTALSTALKSLTAADTAVADATKIATDAQKQQMAVMDALAVSARGEAEAQGVTIATQDGLAASAEKGEAASKLMTGGMLLAGAAVAGLGYESIKAAANFQDATTHLVTDAGENKNALQQAQAGILQMSAATGTSANDMVNAMYHIDSAGYHVANGGLAVLKVAAEGAKVGGADLDTVSKTLVGTMNALGVGSSGAASVMNQLIATVGAGDMRMQDLASSISNVVPIAAAAHISFAQVGGAIATMTSQGMSADQASQDLANTIRSLNNPTKTQIDEMTALGLNSNKVSSELGKAGLTGTIQELFEAIAKNTKGGQVLISTLKNTQMATADANQMITKLPASLQKMAHGMLNGTVTTAQWSAALKGLGVPQKELGTQFEALVKKTSQFSTQLTSGGNAAQTVNAALAKLTGNSTAMNTALLVGNGRMSTFQQNVNTIAAAAQKGGTDVDNWATIQGTMNQKMDEMKSSVSAAGISIGTVLIPPATKIVGIISDGATKVASFVTNNKTLMGLLLSMGAAIAGVAAAYKLWTIAMDAWKAVQAAVNVLMGTFDAEADANPIGILIIAIGALVGALIYCYVHFKTFRDIVNDVFKFVKTAVVDYWNYSIAIFKGVAKAAETLWHALVTAFNAVIHAAEDVWNALSKAWNAVWSVTSAVWNAISDFFKKWWPLLLVIFYPFVALIIGLWNHFHEDVWNTMVRVWNDIVGFFKTIWGGIETAAKAVWGFIKTTIIKPVQDIWDFIQKIWNAVKPYLEKIWNGIKSTADTVWNAIHNSIISPIERAWNDVTTFVGKIAKALSDGFNSAKKTLTNMWQDWVTIGEDIIKGIISGVENMGSSLLKSIGGVANSALSGAKHLLGIGSPSKVFATEIGQWIPAGIGVGITGNAGAVQTALKKLSTQMPGMVSAAGIGTSLTSSFNLGGASGFGAGGTAGAGIYVDLRGSQVMSNQDMDLLVNKLGRVLATKMLPQAGVRIRS